MPGGNGMGPVGQGQGWGQGRGPGQGQGKGLGRGNKFGESAGEFCVCPSCGEKTPHQRGIPCNSINCPKCSVAMVRV